MCCAHNGLQLIVKTDYSVHKYIPFDLFVSVDVETGTATSCFLFLLCLSRRQQPNINGGTNE